MMTFILSHQPYYQNQPDGINLFYGIALYPDEIGSKVKKPMTECTGREVLEELLHHLGFDAHAEKILDSSLVRPCFMPFITSQFVKRKISDRPDVVPQGSTNLALIGQYVEIPDDVVFTVDTRCVEPRWPSTACSPRSGRSRHRSGM